LFVFLLNRFQLNGSLIVFFKELDEVADAVNAVPAEMMLNTFYIIINFLFIYTNDS